MSEKRGYFDEYENLNFHPYNILVILLILGISTLFLALTVAFLYTRIQAGMPPIRLPNIFIFNTLILLGSSIALHYARKYYLRDDTGNYQRMLLITLLLTLVFLGLQILGWKDLIQKNLFLDKDNSSAYLYLISGLHFAHVFAGLPFLVSFIRTAHVRMKEPVSVLVYFSDPSKKLKLRLLTLYWHFLDGLWIYLVLFFTLNYAFR